MITSGISCVYVQGSTLRSYCGTGIHSNLHLRVLHLFIRVECLASTMVLETQSSGSVYLMKYCERVQRYL